MKCVIEWAQETGPYVLKYEYRQYSTTGDDGALEVDNGNKLNSAYYKSRIPTAYQWLNNLGSKGDKYGSYSIDQNQDRFNKFWGMTVILFSALAFAFVEERNVLYCSVSGKTANSVKQRYIIFG